MTVQFEKGSKKHTAKKASFPRCSRFADLSQGLVDRDSNGGRKIERTHMIRPDWNADNLVGMAFEKGVRQTVCFRSEDEGIPRLILN